MGKVPSGRPKWGRAGAGTGLDWEDGSLSAVRGGDGESGRYKGSDGAGRTVADLRGFPSAGCNALGKGGQAVEESGVVWVQL